MMTIWNAQKDLSKYILWKNNFFNISFGDLLYPLYLIFIPGLIFLYGYLFKQRKKVLHRLNDANNKMKKIE